MRTYYVSLFLFCIVVFLLSSSHPVAAQEEDGDDHDHDHEHGNDHGNHELEMKMIFPATADSVYLLWTHPKTDETLGLTFVVVGDGNTCGSDQLQEAEELLESITDSQHLHAGDTIVPSTSLDVHLEHASSIVGFPVQIPSDKCLAVFGTHSTEEYGVFFLNTRTMEEFEPSYAEAISGQPPVDGAAERIGGRGILIGTAVCAVVFAATA